MSYNWKKNCDCDVMLHIEIYIIELVSETKFLGVIIDIGLKKQIQHSQREYQKVWAWLSRRDHPVLFLHVRW